MKIFILPILTLFMFFTLSIHAQSPVEYMSSLTTPFEEIEKETWQYLKSVTRGNNARKIESKRKNLVAGFRTLRTEVGKVRTFKGDTLMKPAVLEYLTVSQSVLNEDYAKIVDLEAIADESYDGMEAYLTAQEVAGEKKNAAFEKMAQAQKLYAEQNDINLVDASLSKRQEKIQKASATLEYYNDLYLIFFKSYHQETYVLDAFDREDLNSLEQSLNTLASFSEEGLSQLEKIKGYKGDSSLKEAVRKMLMFYKSEAEKDMVAGVDFFLAKQEFEKIQKRMESKSKRERTQADVDKYNAASKKYNSQVNKLNSMLERVNKNRSNNLNNFNKSTDSFLERNG